MVTESGSNTQGKIKSAKQWLTRAEAHFDQNAATRGELDLLLAEAELRSTRENLQSQPGRLKLNVVQQGIAFGLAAVLVAVGVGAAWWSQPARVESTPPQTVAVTAPFAEPIRPDQALNISAGIMQKTETSPSVAVDSTIHGQEVKSVDKLTSREPTVSQDEMKRLIRAAGQSLRGQTKP